MRKTAWNSFAAISCVGIIAFSAGCAGLTEPSATVTSSGGANIGEAMLEQYNGPKARIAVAKFEVKAAKAYGTVGDGMADMLSGALFQSNRYIVLERQSLEHILKEQDLSASGRVRKETATKTGDIEGAELLVFGAVTEFEPGDSGVSAGAQLGSTLGSFLSLPGMIIGGVIGAVAGSYQTSHIAIDIRIVDARTGRIVGATSVKAKAADIAGMGSISGPALGVGLSGFEKTPMEKAIRIAINKAVEFIAGKTPAEYFHFNESGKVTKSLPTAPAAQAPSAMPALDSKSTLTLYIKAQSANMRTEPSTNGKVLMVLKQGSKLSVIGKTSDWYRVRTENGQEGFVAASVTSSQP